MPEELVSPLPTRPPLKELSPWLCDFFIGKRKFLPPCFPLIPVKRLILILFDGLARKDFKKHDISFIREFLYAEMWNDIPNTRSALNQVFLMKMPHHGMSLLEFLSHHGIKTCFIDRYTDVTIHGKFASEAVVVRSDDQAVNEALKRLTQFNFIFFHQYERDNVYHGKSSFDDHEAIQRIVTRINKVLSKSHDSSTLVVVFSDHGPHVHPVKKLKNPGTNDIKKIKRSLKKNETEVKTCPVLFFYPDGMPR